MPVVAGPVVALPPVVGVGDVFVPVVPVGAVGPTGLVPGEVPPDGLVTGATLDDGPGCGATGPVTGPLVDVEGSGPELVSPPHAANKLVVIPPSATKTIDFFMRNLRAPTAESIRRVLKDTYR